MTGSLPASVVQAFEQLKDVARVRAFGAGGVVEVHCDGRLSEPCGVAGLRFVEALVRDAADLRLIVHSGEHKALRGLGCRDAGDLTWEVPRTVDVEGLRKGVLYLGDYMITAGDGSVARANLPKGDMYQKGWFERLLAATTVTLCMSAHADDDPWWVGFRAGSGAAGAS